MVSDDTRRELDLLWNQGVKEVREDVKEVKNDIRDINIKIDNNQESNKRDIKEVTNSITSFRRWFVALILTLIPAYTAAAIAFFRK